MLKKKLLHCILKTNDPNPIFLGLSIQMIKGMFRTSVLFRSARPPRLPLSPWPRRSTPTAAPSPEAVWSPPRPSARIWSPSGRRTSPWSSPVTGSPCPATAPPRSPPGTKILMMPNGFLKFVSFLIAFMILSLSLSVSYLSHKTPLSHHLSFHGNFMNQFHYKMFFRILLNIRDSLRIGDGPKMFIKGAPEGVLDRCSHIRIGNDKVSPWDPLYFMTIWCHLRPLRN